MLEETTLTTIRTLAARLNPAERLELIRTIIDTTSPKTAQANDLTGDAWRTQLADEAAYWYARSAAERAPYTGQYVAVFKHTLVDHDLDRRALGYQYSGDLALGQCAWDAAGSADGTDGARSAGQTV